MVALQAAAEEEEISYVEILNDFFFLKFLIQIRQDKPAVGDVLY